MSSRRTPGFEKLLFTFGGVGLAFLVVPVLMIFPLSLDPGNALRFPPSGISVRWYQAYLTSRPWLESTLLSLEIAFYASMIAAFLGVGAAIAMSRGHIRGVPAWSFLLISPMLVPH